jgi:hypothetical protein
VASGPAPGQLTTTRSQLTELGSAFGISFDTAYLYDMQASDGGFKNVLAAPAEGANGPLTDGVEQVALYTAAPVSVADGQVVLRTSPSARMESRSSARSFPVAVLAGGGNVLAIGDTGFLREGTAGVADNEVLLERIVEFMAGAG